MSKKKYLPILIFVVILAICVGVGIGAFMDRKEGGEQPSSTSTPTVVSELKYEITCTSYEAVVDDNVDFNYIIAKLHVKTSQNETITLDHFITDEGIQLSEVDSYKEQLEENDLDLNTYQLVSELSGNQEYDANVFIPIQNKEAKSITLSCDLDDVKDMTFILNSIPTVTLEPTSEPTSTPTISQSDPFEIQISSPFEITGELLYGPNELEYSLPSTARVFALPISITSNDGNAYSIGSASFSEDTYGLVNALDSTVHSSKYANMLNTQVTSSNSGYLFFVLLDSEHTNQQYHGIFTVNLAGTDYSYTLDTNLG